MSFFPLDRNITSSSVWLFCTPAELKVWLYLLTQANRVGVVDESTAVIAFRCNLPTATVEGAIEHFLSPDPASRTKTNDGRRLERSGDSKLLILNYSEYQNKDYSTPRTRRYRLKQETVPTVPDRSGTPGNDLHLHQHQHTPLSDVRTVGPVEKWETSTGTATETEARKVWEAVCRTIEAPEHQKQTWLRPTRGVSLEDSTLTVWVPPGAHARWIRQNYIGKLQAALGTTRLKFVTDDPGLPATDAPTAAEWPQGGSVASTSGQSR
jgi:hypothetical protein